jgi:hypothetical protein
MCPESQGGWLGRSPGPAREMAPRLKAAVRARKDKDFLIVGRNDATPGQQYHPPVIILSVMGLRV